MQARLRHRTPRENPSTMEDQKKLLEFYGGSSKVLYHREVTPPAAPQGTTLLPYTFGFDGQKQSGQMETPKKEHPTG